MNEIDLRRFDLNLLVVFEILMIERSVTRAAERLGRTQSAVSHSLSRLRKQLSDPLLIKAGVRMQPTAFALDLLEQARPLLRGMQRVLSPRQIFDPTSSRRVFRVAASDFMQTMFASLLARLRSEAPGVSVEWVSPRDPSLLDLAEGQIDIAITPAPPRMPEGVTGENVGTLQWRCFARKAHPAFSQWGPQAWTKWPHLAVRVSDVLTSPVHIAASARGTGAQDRRVGAALRRDRTDPCEFGPAGHAAGDHQGRTGPSLSSGEQGGPVSYCGAPASHALESRPKRRSGDRLAARSIATHHQKQIRRQVAGIIPDTHAHRPLRFRAATGKHCAASGEPAQFRENAGRAGRRVA